MKSRSQPQHSQGAERGPQRGEYSGALVARVGCGCPALKHVSLRIRGPPLLLSKKQAREPGRLRGRKNTALEVAHQCQDPDIWELSNLRLGHRPPHPSPPYHVQVQPVGQSPQLIDGI